MMYRTHSMMYRTHSMMYSTHSMMYRTHSMMYRTHSMMYRTHSMMYRTHSMMYRSHSMMYRTHSMMYRTHSMMYRTHSMMYMYCCFYMHLGLHQDIQAPPLPILQPVPRRMMTAAALCLSPVPLQHLIQYQHAGCPVNHHHLSLPGPTSSGRRRWLPRTVGCHLLAADL